MSNQIFVLSNQDGDLVGHKYVLSREKKLFAALTADTWLYLNKESIQLHQERVLDTAEVNSISFQGFNVTHFSVNTKLLPNKSVLPEWVYTVKIQEELECIQLSN